MASAEPPSSSTHAHATSRLTRGDMYWYALPGIGITFVYTLTLVMYMKYTTDVLLVSSAAVGTIMLVSKVWDAISDPVAGYLSDRTTLRMGRRKSWILGCSIPLALFTVMLWLPPSGLGETATIAWIAVGVFGFYTAYTGYEVPHLALGAEMSHEAEERNRIYGVRAILKAVGLILTFGIGVALIDSENAERNATPLILAASGFTAISLWLMVWKTPPERADYATRGASNPFRAIRDVWRNPRARNVLIVYFIENCGIGGIGVLVPFVIEYVLEMPGMSAVFLGVYAISQIAGIPLWVKLGDYFEKQHLWMFAMAQSLVGFGLMIFLTAGNWQLMVFSSVLAGTAGACSNTIGTSLKADVIDTDEYETGERKEGSFFAAWSFSNKLAGGLMLGVVGISLEWIGYEPNQIQPESVRNGMLFLMGGLPLIGYSIGIAIFSRFDLKAAEHARIRAEIDARGN